MRAALTAKASNDSATIADTADELLAAALHSVDDRLARIQALKREQPELSNYAIADRVGCSEPTVRRALKQMKAEATV